MRKFLAILLAVLMVVPAFAFTASAEEATPAQKLNIIPIITEWDMPDEDMDPTALEAWRGPNGGQWIYDLWVPNGAVDSNGNPVKSGWVNHYNAGEKAVVRDWTGKGVAVAGWVKLGYQYFAPVDLSGIWETGAVTFDLYLSDPDALGADTIKYDFELRSAKGDDDNEFNAVNGALKGHPTLAQLYGGKLQTGWNHFEIPLTYFGKVDKADDGKTPDQAAINYFRFLNSAYESIGTDGESHTIMMKNICFVDQCTYEATKAPAAQYDAVTPVWNCEEWKAIDGQSIIHSDAMDVDPFKPDLKDVDNDGDLEWALVNIPADSAASAGYLQANAGYNGGAYANNGIKNEIRFNITKDANAVGFQFKLWISSGGVDATPSAAGAVPTKEDAVNSILDQAFYFQISSTGSTTGALSRKLSLRNMFNGNYAENGGLKLDAWNTVQIYFDSETFAETGMPTTFDASHVNYFRIYNGDSFGYYGGLTIAIDDLAVLYDYTEQEPASSDVLDFESRKVQQGNSYVETNIATSSIRFNGYAGTHVKLMEEFPAGATSVSVARNSTWFTTAYDATKGGTINPDTVCFDFYCDVNADATTGAEVLAALTTKNWVFELASPPNNSLDACEMATTQSLTELVNLTVDQILAGGWYKVEIPLSEFAVSTSKDGVAKIDKYNKENGTSYDPYFVDMTALRHIGLFYQTAIKSKGANDTAFFYIDNLYFKDSTYVAPEVEAPKAEIGLSATPSVDNSFNLSYEVTTNEQVVSNPIVNVTFGGKTTSESDVFAFDGILAHRLSDTITTTVIAMDADHKLVRKVFDYSIKQYAENKLANAGSSAELKRMLSDALYYGAAAQSLIGYNTDNLASSAAGILDKTTLDLDQLNTYKIDKVLEGEATENGLAFKSAALVLDSALAIRVAFTGTPDSLTIGDTTYDSNEFVAADGYYYVDFPVSANHFDVEYKAYFGNDASYCLNYSVNHYLATKYKAGNQFADLLAAIYNYGTSADAYATVTGQND